MLIVKDTLLNTKSGKREFAKTPLSPMCVCFFKVKSGIQPVTPAMAGRLYLPLD